MFSPKPTIEPELLVRLASRQDLEAIGELWVELMSFHQSLDARFGIPLHGKTNYIRHIYSAIRDSNYRVLVAQSHGTIVGYVIGYIAQNPPIFPLPTYGFIADLSVTQHARRLGIGQQLVDSLCAWFHARGMRSIQLNVAHHNPISQAFWRKMGCTDYLDHMWMPLEHE